MNWKFERGNSIKVESKAEDFFPYDFRVFSNRKDKVIVEIITSSLKPWTRIDVSFFISCGLQIAYGFSLHFRETQPIISRIAINN